MGWAVPTFESVSPTVAFVIPSLEFVIPSVAEESIRIVPHRGFRIGMMINRLFFLLS